MCALNKPSYLLGQQIPGVLTAQMESLLWELRLHLPVSPKCNDARVRRKEKTQLLVIRKLKTETKFRHKSSLIPQRCFL